MLSTGKKFENRFKEWHKDLKNVICIKYPDMASSGNNSKALCDYMVLHSGRTVYYELKHTNNKVSFSLNLIKKHQLQTLLNIQKTGNAAFFLIEDGDKNVYMVLPTTVYFAFYNKKKSIKFNELDFYKLKKENYLKLFESNL